MDYEQQKSVYKETFNNVASAYDSNALRFFVNSAQHLATCLDLDGDEHVIDVATGTGNAALALAPYLPDGRVTGIDFSYAMLDIARNKAKLQNVHNVDFIEQDMQTLALSETEYDVAVCSFGIFFVSDMNTQLSRIVDMVKPGGKVAITCFQENYFQPLSGLMLDRLSSYGVEIPHQQPWKLIATESGCYDFFNSAGLQNIRIESKNVGYYLIDADEWWEIIWNAGYRRLIGQMTDKERKNFKNDHLKEIGLLRTKDGIWLDIGVLYAIGSKPLF